MTGKPGTGLPRTVSQRARLAVTVGGVVQGVGFRPFVYRLACALELDGWVTNTPAGVSLEVEGDPDRLAAFLLRIEREKPPRASIQSLEPVYLDPAGYAGFEIRPSVHAGPVRALILPDIATCRECIAEIFDPDDRRYRYPFTNCTHCGPRYSIIERLPYDRARTTMRHFAQCPRCRAEYDDPRDRRFHAQPNACPACGPRLALWDPRVAPAGAPLAVEDAALRRTVAALRQGRIVAVKGLGGFHLLADARIQAAVLRLRERKRREEKPFALMYPHVAAIRRDCELSVLEARLLRSPEAPIVLLRRRGPAGLAPAVAPGNPCLGIMLPATPLHHLVLRDLGAPVVATSGNRADEPICTDERDALLRLGPLTDLLLVHDRPIRRHVDDSIVRVVQGRELVLRRGRGYAPLPIQVDRPLPGVLAVGADLKNAVAVAAGRDVFVSQHVGDLQTAEAQAAFRQVIGDLQQLCDRQPALIACDAHPDYLSTHYARDCDRRVVPVQHHCAHVLSCMIDNRLQAPVLGVAWDGTGYGPDGTVWGGEFLQVTEAGIRRAGHLRTFPLPGGDAAAREPRRAALGLLFERYGEAAFERPDLRPLIDRCGFSAGELRLLRAALRRRVNSPRTSSVGRLFDAVSALVGLRRFSRFEGQAAMELEFAATAAEDGHYDFALVAPLPENGRPVIADWEPVLRRLRRDLHDEVGVGAIATRFHNGLARLIVRMAQRLGARRVVLSGGCFQNVQLTERAVAGLRAAGLSPYWHQRVPPNDGGIALGQAGGAARWVAARYRAPCERAGARSERGDDDVSCDSR